MDLGTDSRNLGRVVTVVVLLGMIIAMAVSVTVLHRRTMDALDPATISSVKQAYPDATRVSVHGGRATFISGGQACTVQVVDHKVVGPEECKPLGSSK